MRDIYLASNSTARKQLLKLFGLKFKVMPSGVVEKAAAGRMSYESLVRYNARKKALWVAARVKKGIVIAADTIVVQDKKIFGKPKDMEDARRMLKCLSRRPQMLYTGLVVIDVERNSRREDVEKTKVYMDPLTDKQIDRYFAQVCPLDKAGGFDIQGRGAFFISRIEGCFYNVVGLPVRALYRMLSSLGVRVLGVMLITGLCISSGVMLSGCSTEYNVVTGEEEKYFYTTDREVALGEAIARQVEQQYKLADDPLVAQRVEAIGEKIAAVTDRKDIYYTFKVLQDEEVNAVSLPGGFVYVNKGLIDRVSNDDELAGVLAHEVGHITARHSIKKLQAMQGYSIARLLMIAVPEGGGAGVAADVAFTELLLGYSREDELLADKLGARYAARAGYDPHGMITFLGKLRDINRRKPAKPRTYFRTHPYAPDRIRVTKEEIGEKMNFTDYINIQDQAHPVR